MRTVVATLKSASALSWSRHYADDVPKGQKEDHHEYEKRTWKEKCFYDAKGNVQIPPMAFKKCLDGAASFLGEKIKGKGQARQGKAR